MTILGFVIVINTQQGKWCDWEQGQPSIAPEALQNLSFVSIQVKGHFWANLTHHNEIYHGRTPKNQTKILDFRVHYQCEK